jgi:hypothetical protein
MWYASPVLKLHDDGPCIAFFIYHVFIALLLLCYIQACIYVELRDACVGMGIVLPGVCGVEIGRIRRFGYFGGGDLRDACVWMGIVLPQCIPAFTVFGA